MLHKHEMPAVLADPVFPVPENRYRMSLWYAAPPLSGAFEKLSISSGFSSPRICVGVPSPSPVFHWVFDFAQLTSPSPPHTSPIPEYWPLSELSSLMQSGHQGSATQLRQIQRSSAGAFYQYKRIYHSQPLHVIQEFGRGLTEESMPIDPQKGPGRKLLTSFSYPRIFGTIRLRTLNAGLFASVLACATRIWTSAIVILC